MIHLLGKIPDDITIACSGGSDSMAALHFLNNGKRRVRVAYFDHGTEHGMEAETFVERHCANNGIPYICGRVTSMCEPRQSQEEFWRNSRYEFFTELVGPIVMGHHLDDVAEWWMFSSLRGYSKLIPYRNGDVIRPFLATTKQELLEWVQRNNIPFIDDPSNRNTKYMRNHIRHNIMPHAFKVNPGLHSVLKKKLIEDFRHKEENNGQAQ
jgi:tRNA(Ile)-lysidine synthase